MKKTLVSGRVLRPIIGINLLSCYQESPGDGGQTLLWESATDHCPLIVRTSLDLCDLTGMSVDLWGHLLVITVCMQWSVVSGQWSVHRAVQNTADTQDIENAGTNSMRLIYIRYVFGSHAMTY